jgi:hypothetical protein
MSLMRTYEEQLTDAERAAVEAALDTLKDELPACSLDMSDHAARAAEAMAVYIVASKQSQQDRANMRRAGAEKAP